MPLPSTDWLVYLCRWGRLPIDFVSLIFLFCLAFFLVFRSPERPFPYALGSKTQLSVESAAEPAADKTFIHV